MKNKITIAFLTLALFAFGGHVAQAHQPNYVDGQTSITVKDAEVSKAFYGELNGQRAIYTIQSDIPFKFYAGLLTADLPDAQKNYSAEITDQNSKVIAFLNGQNFAWTKWFEEYAGDWYWQGPEYRADLPAGTYTIKVFNPANSGRYVLATGETESFPAGSMFTMISQLFQMKTNFFQKPWYSIYEGKIGGYMLMGTIAILIIIFIIIGLSIYKGRRAKRNSALV